ncbi:MAG: type II secretion system minor pseudopilin GspK [Gammaproteobacteria bacterium]|nr:type II secretion system minor pseudopilin GspK [Gammaproteobacteria bacterium]
MNREQNNTRLPGKNRGIALLTALLVVAIATTAAVAMASRQQIDIRRTENLLRMEQAWQYVEGIDVWAMGQLMQDSDKNKTDGPLDDWNSPITEKIDAGEIAARIIDLQGRFNLNDLVQNGLPHEPSIVRFRRLLSVLELSPELLDGVVDWIDPDAEVRFPNGAEDDTYTGKTPPYRAANAPMAHPRELLFIVGFDREHYDKLMPHITTLPESTPVNINSATPVVLRSLAAELSIDDAEMLIESREEEHFSEMDEFLQHKALAGLEIDKQGLAFTSDYFQVLGAVQVGRQQLKHETILKRQETGRPLRVQRQRRGFFGE